jgi:hypothetical protein
MNFILGATSLIGAIISGIMVIIVVYAFCRIGLWLVNRYDG